MAMPPEPCERSQAIRLTRVAVSRMPANDILVPGTCRPGAVRNWSIWSRVQVGASALCACMASE